MAFSPIFGIDEDYFLNIYNNNVADITYQSTIIDIPLYLEITITNGLESEKFQVNYSLPNGNFYNFKFNFKEVFKSLMSVTNLSDTIQPFNKIIKDDGLLSDYQVKYEIIYDDPLDNDSVDYDYRAFKSVEQIGETIQKPITQPYILNKNKLTVFKGYIFDFSIYTDSSIEINNLTNGNIVFDGVVSAGVNRVYLSRGKYLLDQLDEATEYEVRVSSTGGTLVSNPCLVYDEEPILKKGGNDLRIDLGGYDSKFLEVKLIEPCEGVYLKWFNEEGAWNYWLFNNVHKDKINSKVIDIYNTDFESIEETYFPSLITGKKAQNTLDLYYNGLEDYEYDYIKSIITSPRVELFIGNINDDYAKTVTNGGDDYTKAWTTVRVLDGSITKNTKRELQNISISIDKNKYTQS